MLKLLIILIIPLTACANFKQNIKTIADNAISIEKSQDNIQIKINAEYVRLYEFAKGMVQ